MRKLLTLLLISLLFAGCGHWESIEPLYGSEKVVVDNRLEGNWLLYDRSYKQVPEALIRVDPLQNKAGYFVAGVVAGNGYSSANAAEVHLVRLRKYLFADMAASSRSEVKPLATRADFPQRRVVHAIARIDIGNRVISVRMMKGGRVPEVLGTKAVSAQLLFASTEALQKLVLTHAEDPNVFPDETIYLCREDADCGLEVPRQQAAEHPRDPNALGMLAAAYADRGRLDDAWAAWHRETDRPRDTYEGIFAFARSLINHGHADDAIAIIKGAFDRRPKPDALWKWLALGNIYLVLDRPGDAAASFRTALELPHGYEAARINLGLGLSYLETGEFDRALAALREYRVRAIALESLTGQKPHNSYLGLAFFVQGNYTEAANEFGAGTVDHDPAELVWRCLALSHLHDTADASTTLDDYRERISVRDADRFEKFEKPLIDFMRGKSSEAQLLEAASPPALAVEPGDRALAYFVIAERYLLAGQRPQALDFYRRSLDATSFSFETLRPVPSDFSPVAWQGIYLHVAANARLRQLRAMPAESGASHK